MKAFQIYHLNLAFSSIPAKSRPEVIQRCYWPLLKMAEDLCIPIGVELTGWTLDQIRQIDPSWVEHFKQMLHAQQCELIGSGWTQMIGPLAAPEANHWNQKLGVEAYEKLLGLRPRLVLVNEMAYSTSMVDLYLSAGYEGMIMDRDNVRLALDLDHQPASRVPTHALGLQKQVFPVLWSDSILFQRLQRVVHGDIPVSEYLDYVRKRASEDCQVLPAYCNDVEIFDFRPGRFTTEAKLHTEGEWTRMRRVYTAVATDLGIQWVSPSDALHAQNEGRKVKPRILSSVAHPIPVKKQAKYNINRWALTGRNDLWLNTTCHEICQRLVREGSAKAEQWRELCEFWASDLRTHITEDRWLDILARIDSFRESLPPYPCKHDAEARVPASSHLPECKIERGEDDILWSFDTAHTHLVLNARRGLTIKSLAFKSQGFKPLLGTIPQGFFDSIELGADYYSGGVLIEIPGERVRLTDLEWVRPEIVHTDHSVQIVGVLPLAKGKLKKTIIIDLESEAIRMTYEFQDFPRPLGIVRVGVLTLIPGFMGLPLSLHCQNGGTETEHFLVSSDVNHGQPASQFVSSTSAMGATDGQVMLLDNTGRGFKVEWEPAACAAVPLLKHLRTPHSHLTRLSFSLSELDDTSRPGGKLLPFDVVLAPVGGES
ncbi:hypothetical protein [Prosthecobacter debontii]|uniref:hypothetical protein n=1 Tax=Prosthecobacter debontii TaxID=48467 RepID=UPI001116D28C|nr:hypothetical protein [Prosthecobacter debontii]